MQACGNNRFSELGLSDSGLFGGQILSGNQKVERQFKQALTVHNGISGTMASLLKGHQVIVRPQWILNSL